MNHNELLVKYIKDYREMYELSVEDFAVLADLDPLLVEVFEINVPYPITMDMLQNIAKATDISLEHLLVKLRYIDCTECKHIKLLQKYELLKEHLVYINKLTNIFNDTDIF